MTVSGAAAGEPLEWDNGIRQALAELARAFLQKLPE